MLAVWAIEAIFLVSDLERGLVVWLQTGYQVRETRRELADRVEERRELRSRKEALEGDREAIERAAREELFMVRPGERVFRFDEPEEEPGSP